MCISSVAPMPSMISMPVASFQSARVAAGSASPAATHLRSKPPSRTPIFFSRAPAAIARYDVGAVKHTVARCATMAWSRSGGPAFSSSTVDAPMCIGNSVRPPRPKVNARGGLPMKTSSFVGAQHVRRKAHASRHHVAVEVHRRLRLAGGARGEGEQAGVVGGGVDVGEGRVVVRHQRFEAGGRRRIAEADDAREKRRRGRSRVELAAQRRVAQGDRHLGFFDDLHQLFRTQHRHRRHGDAPRFHHREPAGHEHRLVGRAQQNAVAGHEAAFGDEHVGDAVGLALQLGVGPRRAVRGAHAAPAHLGPPAHGGRATRWRSSGARGIAARAGRRGSRAAPRPRAGGRARRCRRERWWAWRRGGQPSPRPSPASGRGSPSSASWRGSRGALCRSAVLSPLSRLRERAGVRGGLHAPIKTPRSR